MRAPAEKSFHFLSVYQCPFKAEKQIISRLIAISEIVPAGRRVLDILPIVSAMRKWMWAIDLEWKHIELAPSANA